MVGYQATFVRQWMTFAFAVTDMYLSLLDPRPDLAVRARSVRVPYSWWW
jgi:hypothetical protein